MKKNKSPPVSGPMSSGLAFVQKDVGRPWYLEIPLHQVLLPSDRTS